ncbi:MAG: HAMP domain-containing sensor histidine kinase [Tissierellia bacterium]|nr:HAMP domain-containing sensor histidine kinase [Tissierellia bacterium]
MKSKITKKLVFYFLLIIVAFSIVSGILVYFVGRKNLETNYILDLKSKTEKISISISQALEYEKTLNMDPRSSSGTGKMRGQAMGKGLGSNYISWIKGFLLSDVRLVMTEDKFINDNKKMIKGTIVDLKDLNEAEKVLVKTAVNGGLVSYNTWKDDGKKQTEIAVASPIFDRDNRLIGAVLVNELVNFNQAIFSTAISNLIISMLVGGLLVFGLAIFFAKRFIKPLNTINNSTRELIKGNYQVRNQIDEEDEIGQLANNLDELAQRLDLAREKSNKLDQMRDDFVSSMSHELKTPVTVIKSYLEALNSGLIVDQDEVKKYHAILYDEAGLLESLIFDLMDLNMLRNGKFKITKDEINLIDVIKDAIKSQEIKAKKKDIKLKANFQAAYLDFQGDYSRLRQLFTIIIDNAIKYSKAGSRVDIFQKNTGNIFKIDIINPGKEIGDDKLKHIFEPFYRGKDTKEKGFGLGLAIAKQITDQHDLDIMISHVKNENIFSIIHNKNK